MKNVIIKHINTYSFARFADYYIDIVTRIYLHGSPKLLGKEQEYLEEQAQGTPELRLPALSDHILWSFKTGGRSWQGE